MQVIQCVLENHAYAYEVHTIAQIFFPNSKFSFSDSEAIEKLPKQFPITLISRITDQEATGEVYVNGVFYVSHTVHTARYITVKRAVMLSLFHALKKVIDTYTPWGALTGVRPSMLVRQWMSEGNTDEEIIRTLIDPFCCNQQKAKLALEVAHAEKRVSKRIKGTGLYVSIPFCPSRCLYCSFTTAGKKSHEDYIHALIREIKQKMKKADTITSIYIGGGTPTVISEDLLQLLLTTVCQSFPLSNELEFTVEAGRPDSITPQKLRILRDHGVNRIAVNPQSLNDRTLKLIGRNHTADDVFRTYEMVRTAGFECVNMDIIAGLPDETAEDMVRTLEGIMRLSPENITVHTLAIKRASILSKNLKEYRHRSDSVYETEKMLTLTYEACDKAGLSPYYLYRQKNMVGLFENVGYSRPGFECLYNVGMMAETQSIIGVGAAAVSKQVDGNKIEREFNIKNPDLYCL